MGCVSAQLDKTRYVKPNPIGWVPPVETKGNSMKKIVSITLLSLLGLALVAFSIFGIRQTLAKREIAAEWESQPATAPQLKTTS